MCTRDARLPIVVDSLGALTFGIAGGAAVSEGSDSDTQNAGIAMLGVGILAAVSAVVGIRRQDDCAQAWNAYANGERH